MLSFKRINYRSNSPCAAKRHWNRLSVESWLWIARPFIVESRKSRQHNLHASLLYLMCTIAEAIMLIMMMIMVTFSG